MHEIKVLKTEVANKIAAGEIICNPAAVVKELVENSIDAGSTRIGVEIVSGGKEMIKVYDNGVGIKPEDMPLALKRHATSKIYRIEDLDCIGTMGFRGEALASIASVTKIKLTSKTKDSPLGWRIAQEGGKILNTPTPVGCSEGTSVEVLDLFYNIPARRKYLKTDSREAYHINEVMVRLGLSHPAISFTFKNNNRIIYQTSGNGDLRDCIINFYGMDAAENMIPVEGHSEDWVIKGMITKPFFTRSNRKYQHFYINKRWVANRNLRNTLDRAYYTLTPRGRFPMAVLFLDTCTASLDVNVDPTKSVVRIENENKLKKLLSDTIKKSLPRSTHPSWSVEQKTETPRPLPSMNFKNASQNLMYSDNTSSHGVTQDTFYPLVEINNQPLVKEAAAAILEEKVPLLVMGQLNRSYIICHGQNNLYIIDQHAAHERVQYEKMCKKKKTSGKQIILPTKIDLTSSQHLLLKDSRDVFDSLGFNIDYFGGGSIILREIPAFFTNTDFKGVFLDILDDLVEDNKATEVTEEEVTKQIACKTSIKAGQSMNESEMSTLVTDLLNTRTPMTCPHGRPTTIVISNHQLEKEFLRK
ncbi:MAG: DNA mismatch repair endonuclease MutL [Clostridia bacterium]|nr:DNA mismatch repair endonuclease MutL [Clostridia bacterium]